ncbi:C39 family peptidase [Brevibacillus borstelensis]|uniref:C39 family peptidase n=1 Tax=Brevibacillus borstelensis TaxID=45462 RepID=UPI0030C31C34
MRQKAITILAAWGILLAGCGAAAPETEKFQPVPRNEQQSSQEQNSEQSAIPVPRLTLQTNTATPSKAMLDVPIIAQNPELKNGCEVTSLAMLLRHSGHPVDKMTLARQVKKDPEPIVQQNGDIQKWGDPAEGFVGDMTGKKKGFAVYNKPLEELLRRYLGERTVNLTGASYETLLDSVAAGFPVVIWATGDFTPPTEWEYWDSDGKQIVVPFDEHAVLLVGYDKTHAYVNDPLTARKQRRVAHSALKNSWEALGKQAITYR